MVSDSRQAAGGGDNDDTLIRPARDFYRDQPPEQLDTKPGRSQPTLAERIMHRLPAPPEKAAARQEYEAQQADREAERKRALEELKRQDAEAEAAAAAKREQATATRITPAQQPPPTRAAAAPATAAAAGPRDPEQPVRHSRRTRRARLRLSRVDPWSVMKTFFLFSIAGGIMFFTAVVVIYTVIDGSGLFDSVDQLVKDTFGQPSDDTPFQVREILGWERVMGVTALLACVNVVILTALATLGSFLYNLSATMLGGLEVTLAED